MSINKAFVVKNGFEVSTDLILANADTRKVGIASTNPQYTLDVAGGIGATDFYLTGIGTFANELNVGPGGTVLTVLGLGNSIGIGTALPAYLVDIRSPVSTGQTALYVQGDVEITGDIRADDLFIDDAEIEDLTVIDTFLVVGLSTFSSNVFIDASLNVSGLTTLGNYVDINNSVDIGVDLNVSGVTTTGSLSIGSTQVISDTFELQNITSLDAITIATIEAAIEDAPNNFTDINISGISTLGTVLVSSGIITATSGIVTYYGDGTYLDLSANSTLPPSGIGIGTTGGVVGYGITFIDFYGAGVSTAFYDGSVGIATIFFEGGGSGTIGIGTEFPISAVNGDLFFSAEFGRLFVYYDEVAIGVGLSAFWIDAAPFNINLSQLDDLQVNNLVVVNNTNLNNLNVTGISTLTNLDVGDVNSSGIVTASAFLGDGSGLTGTGSTVFDDTTTDLEFFPLFTDIITGTITASGISTSKLTYNPFTGTLTVIDLNSTSDINLKENIKTVENALETVSSLRGVSFDWKENGKSSYGVIAQELEEVLPELVKAGDVKSVNYHGLIGVLIEAIKELKAEVEELKKTK
jgi:hypothetical protein